MEFPTKVKAILEEMATQEGTKKLKGVAEALSLRYRDTASDRALTTPTQALSYALVRMPATFGAVDAAFAAVSASIPDFTPKTLLDVGAGTGAATLAACAAFSTLEIVDCIEAQPSMAELGKKLTTEQDVKICWITGDLNALSDEKTYDLVVASYVLNELSLEQTEAVLKKLWKCTSGALVLVEPGTPQAAMQMQTYRNVLLEQGGTIAAPCPQGGVCNVAEGDWCHFRVRIARSRLHRQLKGGESPFEDEKFTYLVFTRLPATPCKARVTRHPVIDPKLVSLTVCTASADGWQTETVRKSHPSYKTARKIKIGDAWE